MPVQSAGASALSVACQLGKGLLGQPGTLLLERERLVFTPRKARPSWLGGGPVALELRQIEGISVDGGLAVEAGGKVHRFTGGGAPRLALLLESELLAMRGAPSRFAAGARFLAHGEARWELESGDSGQGHVVLVEDQLLWWTGRGEPQSLPIGRLRSVELEAATGAVIVDDGEQEVVFHTGCAGALCAWLAVAVGGARVPLGAQVHVASGGALGAELYLGLRSGLLVLVRSGRGGSCRRLKIADLVALVGKGARLELHWRGGSEALELGEAAGAAAVRSLLLEQMQVWQQAGAAWGGQELARFDARLPALADEEPRFLQPALRVEGERRLAGSLALYEDRLVFVPADGSASSALPVDGLVRSRSVGPSLVGFVGQRAAFQLAGAKAEVESFWDLLQAPARLLTGRGITAAAVARLRGEAAWLRLGPRDESQEVEEHGEVRVQVSECSLRFELEGRAPSWVKPGVELHLELGRREGLTHVHAAVKRAMPLGRRWRLDLESPDRIEIFNKREAYRAPAEGAAQLVDAEGRSLGSAALRDVSASGVGLRSAPALAVGQRVEVQLAIEGEAELRLPVRVVRQDRYGGGVVLGLKVGMDELDEARQTELAALVMRLQLAWLARRLGESDMDDAG